MGSESSSNSSEFDMSNQSLNRARQNRDKKERQSGFDTYNRQTSASKKNEKKGGTALPVSRPTKAVTQNMRLAQDLEEKAKQSQINIPVPTFGTVAANTIASLNYTNQAKQLRSGGNAVFDSMGNYQGVVSDGTYSGNADFSPIGRSDVSFDSKTGNYTSSAMQRDSGGSEQGNNTQGNTNVSSTNVTDSTGTSLSTASRRALISGAGGGASRRNLL